MENNNNNDKPNFVIQVSCPEVKTTDKQFNISALSQELTKAKPRATKEESKDKPEQGEREVHKPSKEDVKKVLQQNKQLLFHNIQSVVLAPFIITDIDGTITINPNDFVWSLVLDFTPLQHNGVQDFLWMAYYRGINIVYLTARSIEDLSITQNHLGAFPPGPLWMSPRGRFVSARDETVGDRLANKHFNLHAIANVMGFNCLGVFGDTIYDHIGYEHAFPGVRHFQVYPTGNIHVYAYTADFGWTTYPQLATQLYNQLN